MAAKLHTCSVCLEVFSDPKVLPCCHIFCLKCLEKTARSAQREGEITCPQCCKTHAIPPSGMTGFLTDFIASHEIEVEQLKSPTAVCGECEEAKVGPVEYYCCDCQSHLCLSCVHAHKTLRAYRGHKVIRIEELNVATLQSRQVQHCTTHRDESLKLFCKTCTMLVCRDCTLVGHRDHQYTFVQDARKEITDDLHILSQEVQRKLVMFQANLGEIRKVESTAARYSEALKADVNIFSDKLVQSIEARRKQLLKQVDVECQKDLKQIRADKDFHKSTISQISSVFGLTKKAVTCTSDVEMVLTALQCIHQLKQLKGTEWESDAFIHLLSTQATFSNNLKQDIRKIGVVNRPHEGKSIILPIPQSVELGQILTFNIKNNKALLDFRSGEQVKLQGTKSREIGVSITYGQSKKALDTGKITITENLYGISEVAVRLVCGGVHTITITIGDKPVEGNPFVVNVEGVPKVGDRVTKGPDWNSDTPPNVGGGLSLCRPTPGPNVGGFYSQQPTPGPNRTGLSSRWSTPGPNTGGLSQFTFGRGPNTGDLSQCRRTVGGGVTVLPRTSVQGQNTQMEAQSGVVRNVSEGVQFGRAEQLSSVIQPSRSNVKQYKVKVDWNHSSRNHVWGGPKGCYEIELL